MKLHSGVFLLLTCLLVKTHSFSAFLQSRELSNSCISSFCRSSRSLSLAVEDGPKNPKLTRKRGFRMKTYRNRYPIVLVPGVMGWGREEFFKFRYFGGLRGDLQNDLEQQGYHVLTVSPGPVSSAWDRACEIYAQLKGGIVDYGAHHTSQFNHSRYGRSFRGLYPEWGTTDDQGNVHKIHLLGHSLGGVTARILADLLEYGNKNETTFYKGNKTFKIEKNKLKNRVSGLFLGGKGDWIHSITVMSSPLLGSSLANSLDETVGNGLQSFFISLIGLLGSVGDASKIFYDFKLEHWNTRNRQGNETLAEYAKRITSSQIFHIRNKDSAVYDLTMTGARAMAKNLKESKKIFYFSYGSGDSMQTYWFIGWQIVTVHIPRLTMIPVLYMNSLIVGGVWVLQNGFGPTWQENDGCVNTPSMTPNHTDWHDRQHVTSGQWNRIDKLTYDHLSIVGWNALRDIFPLFREHAHLLSTIENIDPTKAIQIEEHQESRSRQLNDEMKIVDKDVLTVEIPQNVRDGLTRSIEYVNNQQEGSTMEEVRAYCSSKHHTVSVHYCSSMEKVATHRKKQNIIFYLIIGAVCVFSIAILFGTIKIFRKFRRNSNNDLTIVTP